MNTSHYVEVAVKGGSESSLLVRRQFAVAAVIADLIHRENAHLGEDTESRLGMAFPHLGESLRAPFAVIRVFGSESAMSDLQPRITASFGEEASVSGVREVPRQYGLRAFIRDRTGDRRFPQYNDRALRRSQRKTMERVGRGEAVVKPPMGIVEREESRLGRVEAALETLSAHIRLHSRSTGQGFSLFVTAVAQPNGDPEGIFDSYGLSRKSCLKALPHF